MRVPNKPLLQRIPNLMMPLLVMAFSASLAKLVWMVFAPPEDVAAAPIQIAATPNIPQQAPNLGRIIADNHLFGEIKRTAPVRSTPSIQPKFVEPAKSAEPPLKLSLHGLWAKKRSDGRTEESFKVIRLDKEKNIVAQIATDLDAIFDEPAEKPKEPIKKKRTAFAIMSHSGGDQRMYAEGESIVDKVKVIEIFTDKVVVENRGMRQEIFLADGESSNAAAPAYSANAGRPSQRPSNISQAISANIANGQRQVAPGASNPRRQRETLGQKDLRKLREDVINDASLLSQYAAPEPLLMDGTVKGFRLHLSNRMRLLYQVGFRPGDVVTELNGVRLNDPATVQQALYNFISSDQLSISVMRGQNEETFRYNFDGQ